MNRKKKHTYKGRREGREGGREEGRKEGRKEGRNHSLAAEGSVHRIVLH